VVIKVLLKVFDSIFNARFLNKKNGKKIKKNVKTFLHLWNPDPSNHPDKDTFKLNLVR